MHFVSLFFLNKRNITTFFVMIHLRHTVVHYSNLNSNSVNKPFFKLRAVEYAISFFFFCFRLLINVYFNEAFFKKLRSNYHFLMQISEIHSKMLYITNYYVKPYITSNPDITSNSMILKWRHFQHKAKFEKNGLFSLGPK